MIDLTRGKLGTQEDYLASHNSRKHWALGLVLLSTVCYYSCRCNKILLNVIAFFNDLRLKLEIIFIFPFQWNHVCILRIFVCLFYLIPFEPPDTLTGCSDHMSESFAAFNATQLNDLRLPG